MTPEAIAASAEADIDGARRTRPTTISIPMAAKTASDLLKVGTRVVLTEDITSMPAGSAGKVVFVNGLQWVRYWVHFDSGPRLGQIGRNKLATPQDLAGPVAGASATTAGGEPEAAGDGAAKTSSNAFGVPDYLIERSANARVRLAAKG